MAGLYFVGAHGGAGVSTLVGLVEGTATLGARWPLPPVGPVPVILVARTSYAALEAMRVAALDYITSGLPATVDLVGWVFIRDAPGRNLPERLSDRMRRISGAAPRDQRGRPLVWELPWIEAWRLGATPTLDAAPRPYRSFAAAITDLVPALHGGSYSTTALTGENTP